MKRLFKKLSGLGDRMNIELKDGSDTEEDYGDEEYENTEEEDTETADGADSEAEDGEEASEAEDEDKEWPEEVAYEEGQLSIDVYQTPEAIVVKSTIAGVKPEDIDISINNDMLTIRGQREMTEKIKSSDYLFRECYWGSFSRSLILPVEIEPEKIEAYLENGVLTVLLPKAKSAKPISIKVRER